MCVAEIAEFGATVAILLVMVLVSRPTAGSRFELSRLTYLFFEAPLAVGSAFRFFGG